MNPASSTAPTSPAANEPEARPRRYTPGFSDGVGDRLLLFDLFDSTNTAPLEMLAFKREFSDVQGVEMNLRSRVEDLAKLQHPSLGTLRGVEWLEGGQGLALVRNHVAGRRLSQILHSARAPVLELELIRQLTPGLAALQQHGPGFAHGVLTADRVIVTREGRLVIIEYAIGSAFDSLQLPASQLQSQLGLAVADSGEPVSLDQRGDVIQLGFISLSLLLGRRLDPTDFLVKAPALLDEFSHMAPGAAQRLRPWFERAFQLSSDAFASAVDLMAALNELPAQLEAEPEPPRSPLAFRGPEPAPVRPQPLQPTPMHSVPQVTPAQAQPAQDFRPDLRQTPAPKTEVRPIAPRDREIQQFSSE